MVCGCGIGAGEGVGLRACCLTRYLQAELLLIQEHTHTAWRASRAHARMQGKLQEGKTIMRVAGLTRKGMSQNIPASYLR